MSPGQDFQEAFLLLFSDAITLILGITLAVGVLISFARAFIIFLEPGKRERSDEND